MENLELLKQMLEWAKEKRSEMEYAWADSDYDSSAISGNKVDGWEYAFDAIIYELESRIKAIEEIEVVEDMGATENTKLKLER